MRTGPFDHGKLLTFQKTVHMVFVLIQLSALRNSQKSFLDTLYLSTIKKTMQLKNQHDSPMPYWPKKNPTIPLVWYEAASGINNGEYKRKCGSPLHISGFSNSLTGGEAAGILGANLGPFADSCFWLSNHFWTWHYPKLERIIDQYKIRGH